MTYECFRSGFYLGGFIGGSNLQAQATSQTKFITDIGKVYTGPIYSDMSDLNGLIGVHLGYLFVCDKTCFAVGPEVSFRYSHLENAVFREIALPTAYDITVSYKNKLLGSAGARVRVGFVFYNTHFIYGLLGCDVTCMKFSANDTISGEELIVKHKLSPGLTFGIGIEKLLCGRHLIRLEACSTYFSSRTFTGNDMKGNVQFSEFNPRIIDAKLGYSILF